MNKKLSIHISLSQVERGGFYLVVLGIFLFLCTRYFLPMSDLPQHAGQVQTLKAILMGQTDAPWFEHVELNYFTPYWIAYGLGLVLSFVMPMNYALNTVVGVAFLLFVFSFSHLRKRFNGVPILDWMLIPSFFCFAFNVGLITFLLAIPVGVCMLIQTLNGLDRKQKNNTLWIILMGAVLYFSHMLIFLFFCAISAGMIIVNRGDSIKQKMKQLVPFYILSLFIPFFLFTTAFFTPSYLSEILGSSPVETIFSEQRFLLALPYALPAVTEYDYNHLFTSLFNNAVTYPTALILLGLYIAFQPWLLGSRLTKDLKRYVPFFAYLTAWFLLPYAMGNTWLIFHRFSIFLFPFFILLFEKDDFPAKSTRAVLQKIFSPLLIITALFLTNIERSYIQTFNAQMLDFKTLLTHLPKGKRALNLTYKYVIENGEKYKISMYNGLVHFSSWYQALNNGWVDYNFAWYPPQVVRYKEANLPEVDPLFELRTGTFTELEKCDIYDLMIVYVPSQELFSIHNESMKKSKCHQKLKYHNGNWLVYSLE